MIGINLSISGGGAPTPVNTVAPAIAGTPEQGETLTATPGTWTDAGVIVGQWLRDGVDISGETSLTYVVGDFDNGDLISYRETTNGVTAVSNTLTYSEPVPMADVWVASIASANPDAHQGLIRLPAPLSGWITIDDVDIVRWSVDWVEQVRNGSTDVDMGQSGTPGYKLADGLLYNDHIWIHRYDAWHAWDVTTLVYNAALTVSTAADGGYASHSIGPVAGHAYCIRYDNTVGASYIREFDLATGLVVQDIALSINIFTAQGIHYEFGKFYVTGTESDVYEVETDGTVNGVIATIANTVIEGITSLGDSLFILFDGTSGNEVIELARYTTVVAQTTGQTSGDWVVNGDAETGDKTGWASNYNSSVGVINGGGVGAQDDSDLANRSNSDIFQGAGVEYQFYKIPQEAWDSVDAGTATIDTTSVQFGTQDGLVTTVLYGANRSQLVQTRFPTPGYIDPGFGTWEDSGVSGFVVPVGSRSMLVAILLNGTSAFADDIGCVFNW